ncbi:MAG: hydroxyisourate hydrolase [Rhizobiaceae bacterium]
MSKLSTHVLDTSNGHPAANMKIEFVRNPGANEELIKTVVTNADGRTDELLLSAEEMAIGEYELRFHVSDYFIAMGAEMPKPAFLNVVPLRFSIFDTMQGYHVPLLCSPWSYSTYRGS